ncbi:MAG: DUF5076 domain-containing protein [Chthoniobacter sp.]|nr:DUF5076 domain-containing protein [Chthoniobacter sp.]
MDEQNALKIPHTIEGDPKAIEIARIWAAHGGQHVHIRTGIWSDAGNWGIMLSDFAKHIANAYEEDGRGDYFEVLARIRQVFDAEWDAPTEIPTGKLTPKPDEPNTSS